MPDPLLEVYESAPGEFRKVVDDSVVDSNHPRALNGGKLYLFDEGRLAQKNADNEQVKVEKWFAKKAWAKEEASRRILAIAPEWKQRNAAARLAELQAIRLGTYLLDDGTVPPAREWTPEESVEVIAIRQLWDTVKAIRIRSNEIEGLVDTINPSSPTADADLEAIVW